MDAASPGLFTFAIPAGPPRRRLPVEPTLEKKAPELRVQGGNFEQKQGEESIGEDLNAKAVAL